MSGRRTRIHVTPSPKGGWQAKREGSQRPISVTRTQRGAESAARARAKAEKPSQVVIHRKDGRIREEHTYGDDPERYPG